MPGVVCVLVMMEGFEVSMRSRMLPDSMFVGLFNKFCYLIIYTIIILVWPTSWTPALTLYLCVYVCVSEVMTQNCSAHNATFLGAYMNGCYETQSGLICICRME